MHRILEMMKRAYEPEICWHGNVKYAIHSTQSKQFVFLFVSFLCCSKEQTKDVDKSEELEK